MSRPLAQRVLFLCSLNRNRSPTAQKVFEMVPGIEVRSGGLDWGSAREATPDDLVWTDIIFIMERRHRTMLGRKFGPALRGKNVVMLDIPDRFDPMQRELVELLLCRVPQFLGVPVDVDVLRDSLKRGGLLSPFKPLLPSCW